MKISLLLLACVLVLSPGNAFAQNLRVESVTSLSIGGLTSGGSFTLRSSAGEAGPVGETQGGSFSVKSGAIITLPLDPAAILVIHTPPDVRPINQDVSIDATVDDPSKVQSATLMYRRGGESSFTPLEMAIVDNRVVGTIPAEAATSEGVAYYLSLTNETGRTSRTPSSRFYSVRLAVGEPGVVMGAPLPQGTNASDYRIISVPLDLEEKDPESVLVDDLGSYDPAEWRFFELLFDESLAEFPEVSSMVPGKGYWIISAQSDRRIDTGAGTTVGLSDPFSIQLHPGWNLVGNPYHFPVSADAVRLVSGQNFLIRSFEGNWNNPIEDPVEELRPFSGYAVFNGNHIVDELIIDPLPVAGKGGGGGDYVSRLSWGIRITAESKRALDVDNIAAVAETAEDGPDALDFAEPPVVGSYVSVAFIHPEWETPTNRYAADVRADDARGHTWDMEVRGSVSDPIRLHFEGIDDVPASFDVLLVDEMLNEAYDLRQSDVYAVTAPSAGEPRMLKLVVGESAFVKDKLERAHQLSGSFDLLPSFPNPFETGTTIRYVLDKPAAVTMKVYDVVGREVAVLADNLSQDTGPHSLVWDGAGSSGMFLQNGMYYVRLEASGRVRTTAVVKMR